MQNYSVVSTSKITCFDPIKNSWTILGNLNTARFGHGVVQVENEFIVIGGFPKEYFSLGPKWSTKDMIVASESCKLNEIWQTVKCTYRQPKLSYFALYPELFLLP